MSLENRDAHVQARAVWFKADGTSEQNHRGSVSTNQRFENVSY